MNRYDLSRRNAVITGGAGGIGQAIAARFLDSGASVELWDRDPVALEAALAALPGARALEVDVTSPDSIAQALEPARRIDILVNNAGVLGAVTPLWESDPDDFRRVLEVNLVGAYLVSRAVIARMLAQEPAPHRGHVVNVASIQGKEGMAMAAAYSASKAGLIALTKSMAKDTAREKIVVNCITPTAAETAMARQVSEARRQDILSRIPMGRFVGLEEIAAMVSYLCSDETSFSTGAVFDLSGGRATW
jgi:NAD(P)-dependent dehydrogenase (short-subunit alcohol dehydrogenase family)